MDWNPLVSIVVDNYNYDRFLQSSVDSALAQKYRPIEVIVVDDGSTDNSRETIQDYGERIYPVLNENGGQASAFNAGFAVSGGEIVVFLDADDVLLPDAVERVVPEFQDRSIVSVSWPLWVIAANGKRSGAVHPPGSILCGELRGRVIDEGPLSGRFAPTSGNAWSRKFLERVMPVREPGVKHSADAYLTTLAPLFGKMSVISEPLGEFRIHGDNASPSNMHARIEHDLRMYAYQSSLLVEQLRSEGVTVDPAKWRGQDSGYVWMESMLAVRREIEESIPIGLSIVLVDDGMLGSDFFPHHTIQRLVERKREYWGPPENDNEAIEELSRFQKAGAHYLVVIFSSYWWLDHYREFSDYLASKFHCIIRNDFLTVFDLSSC